MIGAQHNEANSFELYEVSKGSGHMVLGFCSDSYFAFCILTSVWIF